MAVADCDGLSGRVQIDVRHAAIEIDAVLLVSAAANPVTPRLSVDVPTLVATGAAVWTWADPRPLDDGQVRPLPTGILIHVADTPGEERANAFAGDGRSGWQLAPFAEVTACPTPVGATPADSVQRGPI